MSVRIHDMPDFFCAMADDTNAILKKGRWWARVHPEEAEKEAEVSVFTLFSLNTG